MVHIKAGSVCYDIIHIMIIHVAFLLKTRITAYSDFMSKNYVKDMSSYTQRFLQNMLRNENNEGNDSNEINCKELHKYISC